MGYRSKRFDAGELTGLQDAWETIDLFNNNHVPVVNEVMAGARYRRQLHPDARAIVGDVDYLLQVTLEPEPRENGERARARYYLDKARQLLGAIPMPGEVVIDEGGLHGWDPTTTRNIFGTGQNETEILKIYPPWLHARWEEAGRRCMFYCGIQPPRPRGDLEDWMFDWSEHLLRAGHIVFTPTPDDLQTW